MLSAYRCLKFYKAILNHRSFLFRDAYVRTFLSEAYACEDVWNKRLLIPPLQDVKMDQFFVQVDKKFQTTRLASGVDIDMFANCVTDTSQLDELEHLLYRFRRTKRAAEMMDSTHYAVVKAYLHFKDYASLFRILMERESYGVFPDMYTYNMLMHAMLKEKNYKGAVQVAVLMMWQEDFSNPISRILGLYSCYQFLQNCPLNSFWVIDELEENEANEKIVKTEDKEDEDEDDVIYVRIPYLRNPWFDDHFDLKDPKHLIGKTLYLIGREEQNLLGRTSQILGLCMYEKWDKAAKKIDALLENAPSFMEEGISKCKEFLSSIPDENEEKSKIIQLFEKKFSVLQNSGKLSPNMILNECENELKRIPKYETQDIKEQHELYSKWEKLRQEAFKKEEKDIDKERRLKIIAEKKEELYWKEKLLFFYENQESILEEYEKVQKIVEEHKSKQIAEGVYTPPEILKKAPIRISAWRRKALIKSLSPSARHKFENM